MSATTRSAGSLRDHLARIEPYRSPALPARAPPVTHPSIAAGDGGDVLSAEQVESWAQRGFVPVDGIWPSELIDEAAAALVAGEGRGIGLGSGYEFPSALAPLNAITLHPRLLRAVGQLLRCDERELRLQESTAWGKTSVSGAAAADAMADGRPAMSNADQRMHMDYPNMYLTHRAACSAFQRLVIPSGIW